MQSYQEFLKTKRIVAKPVGLPDIDDTTLSGVLFDHQKAAVRLALEKGRFLCGFDVGMGKTFVLLEYIKQIDKPAIVVAPLWTIRQTQWHAQHYFDMELVYSKTDNGAKFVITNYENIKNFKFSDREVVVLDESSIIKGETSKYREYLTPACENMRFKLCLSATQSPNSKEEYMYVSDFLGIMSKEEVRAKFFINKTTKAAKKKGVDGWQLAGWAEDEFYKWLASWAIFAKLPSDLGYSDEGYNLPPHTIDVVWVDSNYCPDGQLMATGIGGIGGRSRVRSKTISEKVEAIARDVNSSNEQWVIWRRLIRESNLLSKAIDDNIAVLGRESEQYKMQAIDDFTSGKVKVLIADPKMFGFGVNLQHSYNQAWCGLSDSAETFYQGIGRQVRFGQKRKVNVKVYLSDIEDVIWNNVQRKLQQEIIEPRDKMIQATAKYSKMQIEKKEYVMSEVVRKEKGDGWELWLGDSCILMNDIESESIDFSVSSPPFYDLFAYTGKASDIGNSKTTEEFINHFRFVVEQWYRIMKPGRIVALHTMDVPAMLVKDGYIGMKDFSGDCIRLFEECGFIYDGRIPIDKNQQAQSIRTHSKQLSMRQKEVDTTWLRPALPDYILKFRKPGENKIPVVGNMGNESWIYAANPTWAGTEVESLLEDLYGRVFDTYKELRNVNNRMIIPDNLNLSEEQANVQNSVSALYRIISDIDSFVMTSMPGYVSKSDNNSDDSHPKVVRNSLVEFQDVPDRCSVSGAFSTWYGISESDTLQFNDKTKGHFSKSRDKRDKKHVCPLQLGTIRRAILMWSNPGELVFDPFAGIGSTPYEARIQDRRGFGIEIKPSYFDVAVENMKLTENRQLTMFDLLGEK